jgi:hypothetical protein
MSLTVFEVVVTTFFSAIQNKFKAEYHGRYLGHVLEAIAGETPQIFWPIIRQSSLRSRWRKLLQLNVSSEVRYEKNEVKGAKHRRADLEISISDLSSRVLVEIKVHDHFGEGQLESYIQWAKNRQFEQRAVVVLTAFPLDAISFSVIQKNCDVISHMYLSEFASRLVKFDISSELINLLHRYFREEGYSMYQLNGDFDSPDYRALKSFMALSFLPHLSGHKKAATEDRIAHGPVVFSRFIHNWQLVSKRLATYLSLKRAPTIRYYPEQSLQALSKNSTTPSPGSILTARRNARNNKVWGRYWLTAECVLNGKRLEWGLILQIQHGNKNESIECGVFSLVKTKTREVGASGATWLENGVLNPKLYMPEEFMGLLLKSIKAAKNSAVKSGCEVELEIPET